MSIEEKVKRLTRWKSGSESGPLSLEIWPTNRCNLKCKMCGTWANRRKLEKKGVKYDPKEEKKNEVSDKRLLNLIDEAAELGVKQCLLTGGGEPMMRKSLTMNLMEKVKKLGMFGNINTNGTLLNEKDGKKLIEMDWDMMMFSIDAPNAKDNDFIRGVKGSFNKVKENLEFIREYKEKSDSKKPKIVFNTVLTNRIYKKSEEMIRFAFEMGCEDITFIPLITYDESIKFLDLSKEQEKELQQEIPKIINLSKELGVHTNLSSLRSNLKDSNSENKKEKVKRVKDSSKNLKNSFCFEPFLHFLIKANGETTCCCMLEDSPENIKEKSLKEIWYGEYFENLRNIFLKGKKRKECKNCVFSQSVRNKEIREWLAKPN